MRHAEVVVVVMLVIAGVVAAGADVGVARSVAPSPASMTPQRLVAALGTTPFPNSQLPSGFSAVKVSALDEIPSSTARSHHVVAETYFPVTGPHGPWAYEITYAVFPTAANAHADLGHADPVLGHMHSVGTVPGYSRPSVWQAGTVKRKKADKSFVTNGITAMFVQYDNVLVGAVTLLPNNTRGDVPAARALLTSALRHLQRILGH